MWMGSTFRVVEKPIWLVSFFILRSTLAWLLTRHIESQKMPIFAVFLPQFIDLTFFTIWSLYLLSAFPHLLHMNLTSILLIMFTTSTDLKFDIMWVKFLARTTDLQTIFEVCSPSGNINRKKWRVVILAQFTLLKLLLSNLYYFFLHL